jgi:predicted metal-dependent hydrolase
VSKKSAKIAALIEGCQGHELPAHYLGFFECFNQGLFFESHDVLEELWLPNRHGPNGSFYRGLIQLAGAFVHLQKDRLRPAASLFKLARRNLEAYTPIHDHLEVTQVCGLIDEWLRLLEAGRFETNPLSADRRPRLQLLKKPRFPG